MPRYFCDYCDVYLTHDSAPGRKQHIRGWKHRENVKQYYEQSMTVWNQSHFSVERRGTGIATPSSRRRVDVVEGDAMVQHERTVKF